MKNKSAKRVIVLNYDFDLLAQKPMSCNYEILQISCNSEESITCEVETADVLIVGRTINISARTIRKLIKCSTIIRPGVGCDNIDLEEARKHNIKVLTIPDYCIDEVADHTMALLLSYSRKIIVANDNMNKNISENWSATPYNDIHRLRNRTLGIIGMGCIGQAVANRAASFNIRILYFDPYLKPGMRKVINGEAVSSINQLLKSVQYLSIHAPLTQETNNIITQQMINQIESPIVIINTSRGKLISNETIYTGLKNGKIEAFLADVLEKEPPSMTDSLFHAYMNREPWILGRLIFTPHVAYLSQESTKEVINQTFRLVDTAIGGA